MVSISNAAQTLYMQNLLRSQNQELTALQDQVSSGRKADTYAALGGSATYSSLSLRAQSNQLEAMSNNIAAVTPVTTLMAGAARRGPPPHPPPPLPPPPPAPSMP